MVAGTQQLQQQPEHLQEQAPQDHPQPLPTAEEEAYKRNTDCVYFLASPLTCKKGAECEYRHSEYARVNPRDCWFWLNGNCLNLKCSFRHPPLDGLLGTPHAENTGSSSVTPIQTPAYPSTNAQLNPGKQAVPCIFFQKGLCLKGDRCAFLHGLPPSTTASKSPQPPSVTQPSQQPSTQKNNGGIERGPQEQKIPQPSISKPILVHPRAKIAAKDHEAIQVTQPPRSGLITNRNALPTTGSEDEARRYKVMDVHPALNGNSTSKSSHLHQVHVSGDHGFQNGKETDELLRESSPGFDVLVDDELRDSGYYHNEEQFGRTGGAPEGRNLNSVNEYDRNHSVSDVDRDRFHEGRGFDYDHLQGQYGWEQHRASSERMLVGPTDSDRRGYWKSDSPDRYDESDLRYRLSKQRRGNGLRSVVSNDNALGERSNRASFRRDSHHVGPKENSLSGRLHGRIKLPRRSPPVIDGGDGRYWGRSSPGRTPSSSYQARHRDEIKGRVEENYNNSGRNFRGLPRVRREMMDDGGPDFAPPKRLSELKGEKGGEIRERQSLGKSKSLDDHEQHEGSNLAFEGPKPLSEILKRKREAGATGKLPTNRGDGGNNNQIKTGERLNKKQREQEANNKGKSQSAPTTDAVGTEDGEDKVAANNESYLPLPETEEGMIYDDTMEDHELEGVGQRDDGNYEYEQYEDEEGDYNYEEGDNLVPEGEEYYYEEEEGEESGGGDDVDKKTGVISS